MKSGGIVRKIIVYVVPVVAIGGGIAMIVYSIINPSLAKGSNLFLTGLSFIIIGLLFIFHNS